MLMNVPGFEYILWHTGNTDESTSGCLILGNSQTSNLVKKDGFVGSQALTHTNLSTRKLEMLFFQEV